MGAGCCLRGSRPPGGARTSVDAIADGNVSEALEGVDGTDVPIGLIGEIRVSSDFTATRK
jgi:predicted metal-dependent phosphotriesterase family hydrolase